MQLTADTLRLLDALALRSKRSFYGQRQGAHRSQRRGHGVEFAEYRKYELGDSPRAIDWNLYSRSDKLYIKRYLEEENVELYVIIDGSRSMTHSALRAKWDLASTIATCASYIALATQDPVTVSVLGGPHSQSFWGGKAFTPLTRFIDAATQFISTDEVASIDLAEEARRAATRTKFPGICLFLSDFLYPIATVAATLAGFRARNMEIHAIQVLGSSDLKPVASSPNATLVDSETGATHGISFTSETAAQYQQLLTEHNQALREYCLKHQITYTQTATDSERAPETIALETITSMGLFV
jgi:uncharacterized protein (DUF58 family)